MARHVKFLALAHEGKILASHVHWDKEDPEDYESVLKTIFGSAGWAAVREQKKRKLELKSGENVYCVEIDSDARVYVAVVTSKYPIRHIFSSSSATGPLLMAEFSNHILLHFKHESVASPEKGMKRTLKSFLRDLASRFDDLDGIDRIAAVQTKLDALQSAMARNLALADERESLLQRNVAATDRLARSAKEMFTRTSAVKRAAQCACVRNYVVITVAVLLLVVIAGLLVAAYLFKWFPGR